MQDTTTHRTILLVKLHDKAAQELDLAAGTVTIGRKSDNTLSIDDPAVSGHHARITKIHAVYFIEDLKSTNGTFVNERRIDRHQLRDTDVIMIGRHRIIFRDASDAPVATTDLAENLDHTMVLPGLAAQPDGTAPPANVRVLSGKTEQQEYLLVKQVTPIGSHAQAGIKLTGWFAPRSAAMITRRHNAYFVSRTGNGRKLLVNGQEVTGERRLQDKDRIEVAGVTLLFRAASGKQTESAARLGR
jgi:pSer/pThr/pTyr-binding forkhead associated (FHA) protein